METKVYTSKDLQEVYDSCNPIYQNELKKFMFIKEHFFRDYGFTLGYDDTGLEQLDDAYFLLEQQRELLSNVLKIKKEIFLSVKLPIINEDYFLQHRYKYYGILLYYAQAWELNNSETKPSNVDLIANSLGCDINGEA